jgi:hypothetical protein
MADSDPRQERLQTLATLRATAGEMMARASQEGLRTEILTAAIEIDAAVDSLNRNDVDWSQQIFLTAADYRVKWAAQRLARIQESMEKFRLDATPPRDQQGDK